MASIIESYQFLKKRWPARDKAYYYVANNHRQRPKWTSGLSLSTQSYTITQRLNSSTMQTTMMSKSVRRLLLVGLMKPVPINFVRGFSSIPTTSHFTHLQARNPQKSHCLASNPLSIFLIHEAAHNQWSVCRMAKDQRRSYGNTSGQEDGRNRRPNRGGGRQRRRRNNDPPPPTPPPGSPDRGCYRELLAPGTDVWVVQKQDQRTGAETRGTISRLLTNSRYHPRGIKVQLVSGEVGRVNRIISDGN